MRAEFVGTPLSFEKLHVAFGSAIKCIQLLLTSMMYVTDVESVSAVLLCVELI